MDEQRQFVIDLLELFTQHYTNEQLVLHAMIAMYALAINNDNSPNSVAETLQHYMHDQGEWFDSIRASLDD